MLNTFIEILKKIWELGTQILSWIENDVVGVIVNAVKPAGLFVIKILEVGIEAVKWVISKA